MFPCPRSRLRFRSRETGSAVPPRVSLLISTLKLDLELTRGIPSECIPPYVKLRHIYYTELEEYHGS